jgi:hypothetical protein
MNPVLQTKESNKIEMQEIETEDSKVSKSFLKATITTRKGKTLKFRRDPWGFRSCKDCRWERCKTGKKVKGRHNKALRDYQREHFFSFMNDI